MVAGEREHRTQGQKTMARLLEAGTTVLAERGYHAARVDDIVAAADVSHGTFYLYFASKMELLETLAAQCAIDMSEVVESLEPVASGPEGEVALRSWLERFVASYRRYGVVIRAWMEGTVDDPELVQLGADTFSQVTGLLVDRIEAVGAPSIDDPERAAIALLAMYERFTYYLVSRDLADEPQLVDTLATMIHRGWFGAEVAPAA